MTTNGAVSSTTHTLLDAVTLELYQSEVSVARQCRRDAQRLGNTPPGLALLAVAQHAEAISRELPELSRRNGLPIGDRDKRPAELFHALRDRLFDLLNFQERSYRATLLGCRHGLDLVRTMGHLAVRLGNLDLDAFCSSWLNTRAVLVGRLEDELAWFAAHPDQATAVARPLTTALRRRFDASTQPQT